VGRSSGSWLGGPTSALEDRQDYAGKRLGLPAAGPGSIAPQARKALGYLLDLVAGLLIGGVARLVDSGISQGAVSLAQTAAVLLEILVLQTLTGQSIGQRLTGSRLVDVHSGGPVLMRWVALRLLVQTLPVPGLTAIVTDDDLRGLHDKAAGTVVVRS